MFANNTVPVSQNGVR